VIGGVSDYRGLTLEIFSAHVVGRQGARQAGDVPEADAIEAEQAGELSGARVRPSPPSKAGD